MNPNMRPAESDADFCRRMGFIPGTRLAGDEGYGVTIIQLTAIGERCILAKEISHAGKTSDEYERNWTLSIRDWKPV